MSFSIFFPLVLVLSVSEPLRSKFCLSFAIFLLTSFSTLVPVRCRCLSCPAALESCPSADARSGAAAATPLPDTSRSRGQAGAPPGRSGLSRCLSLSARGRLSRLSSAELPASCRLPVPSAVSQRCRGGCRGRGKAALPGGPR